MRLYAIDARGRTSWGMAAPVIRMMVGDRPPVEPGDSEIMKQLLTPSPEPLLPAAVEPWWKLWKRRELRKPSAYRPPGTEGRPKQGTIS